MTAKRDHDLTGRWSGIFNYPEQLPPNSFEATLRDSGGVISGVTVERDDDPYGNGGFLHAIVEGRREGSSVSFTKIYDEMEPDAVVILYSGTIDPEGNEIHGRWERIDMWSGTFLMVRNPGAEQELDAEVGETLAND
ncbi:MAG TPA: hypothetical protein VF718_00705 [Allosphingosinicella sp.]|jgi:hypothetical protein